MTEWRPEIVQINSVEAHPNADRLEICKVFDYPCITAKGDFRAGDRAVYIPVDSLCPASDPRFSFLVPEPIRKADATDEEWAERQRRYQKEKTEKVRIRAKRLRSVFSMGLLIPADGISGNVGDIVAEQLGIEKYEPDASNKKGHPGGTTGPDSANLPWPKGLPVYTDVEGYRRWPDVFVPGELVVLSEKLHGSSAVVLMQDGVLTVCSHYKCKAPTRAVTVEEDKAWHRACHWTEVKNVLLGVLSFGFRKPRRLPPEPRGVPENAWWAAVRYEDLGRKLADTEGYAVYGEVYGPTQDLHYGSQGQARFAAFDVLNLKEHRWLDYDEFETFCSLREIPAVPVLYKGPWSKDLVELAEGKTTMPGADHVKEGWVGRSIKERQHPRLGRLILKCISHGYLLR